VAYGSVFSTGQEGVGIVQQSDALGARTVAPKDVLARVARLITACVRQVVHAHLAVSGSRHEYPVGRVWKELAAENVGTVSYAQ
jgi:hypothetical protein